MLHVIVFFKRFDEAHHLRGLRAGQLDVILRDHSDFRRFRCNSRFSQCFFYFFQSFRRGHDIPRGAIIFQVVRTSFEHDVQHLVFASGFFGDADFALTAKHPTYRAGFRHVAAVLAHQVSEFTDDAISIGGDNFYEHADATRAVAFKGGFFVLLTFELTGAAEDGALDVIARHVSGLGRQNRSTQPRIRARFAAAYASSDADFADDSRENTATLRI